MDSQSASQGGASRPEGDAVGRSTAVQPVVVHQSRGFFARFGKLLAVALVISLLINLAQRSAYEDYFSEVRGIDEKFYSGSRVADEKIAVIRVEGAILQADGYVKQQIDSVRRDEAVKAVVLRVDSPGGTVTASHYLYHHLRKLSDEREIPIVVSMGGLCASGGYYIAMAVGDTEDAIYAEPTTWTGSIGVIIPYYNVTGLMESWNIEEESIVSGKFKQLASPTNPMTEEEREILQSLVNESFEEFKEVVRYGRPHFRENEQALDDVATGRVFSAEQARDQRLVDRIGFVEDAVERAARLANLDLENIRVIQYEEPFAGILDLVASAQSSGNRGLDLAKLVDMAAPRAYYLCSWLPNLLGSAKP
ncbi:MAG: signal peptide peptidase SppA [Pirellulales bacterium]